jgi:hypothetical protein
MARQEIADLCLEHMKGKRLMCAGQFCGRARRLSIVLCSVVKVVESLSFVVSPTEVLQSCLWAHCRIGVVLQA